MMTFDRGFLHAGLSSRVATEYAYLPSCFIPGPVRWSVHLINIRFCDTDTSYLKQTYDSSNDVDTEIKMFVFISTLLEA